MRLHRRHGYERENSDIYASASTGRRIDEDRRRQCALKAAGVAKVAGLAVVLTSAGEHPGKNTRANQGGAGHLDMNRYVRTASKMAVTAAKAGVEIGRDWTSEHSEKTARRLG